MKMNGKTTNITGKRAGEGKVRDQAQTQSYGQAQTQAQAQAQTRSQPMQGEGNYDAAREFDAQQEAFVSDSEKVARKAREAADALDGDEAEELRAAEQEVRSRRQ